MRSSSTFSIAVFIGMTFAMEMPSAPAASSFSSNWPDGVVVPDIHFVLVGHDDQPFNVILQFPDISRPLNNYQTAS